MMGSNYWQLKQFAQAYGTSMYGSQNYSAANQQQQQGNPGQCQTNCTTTVDPQAPNTSFFGLSTDAAAPLMTGAIFLAIAITGTIFLIVARRRRKGKE